MLGHLLSLPFRRAVLRGAAQAAKGGVYAGAARRGAHDACADARALPARQHAEGQADESLQCLFAEGNLPSCANAEKIVADYLRRAMSSEAEEGKP